MSERDTSEWGYWQWNALRNAACGDVKHYDVKYLKEMDLIDGEVTQEKYEEKKSYGTVSGSRPVFKLRPEAAELWKSHLATFNNCGSDCLNAQAKMTDDDRCRVCGATFLANGKIKKQCKGCGVESDQLYGHIMGTPDYCKACNDKKRAATGTCLMCQKKRWDCCC